MANYDKQLMELKNLIEGAEISLQRARKIMAQLLGDETALVQNEARKMGAARSADDGQVIEGVFDGQNMVGPDNKKYSVPANYASKSKLVEGDHLKLTITPDGSFVYKQIELLERDRLVGDLSIDEETNEYRVLANGKSYKVLTASITYFKGEEGDKAAILVPKGKESAWAAVENIFKPGEMPEAPVQSAAEESQDKKEPAMADEHRVRPAAEIVERQAEKIQSEPAPETRAAEADEQGGADEFLSAEPVLGGIKSAGGEGNKEEPSMVEPQAAAKIVSPPQAVEDIFSQGPGGGAAPGKLEPRTDFLNDDKDDLDVKDNQGLEEL